jgi:hypothetical protein
MRRFFFTRQIRTFRGGFPVNALRNWSRAAALAAVLTFLASEARAQQFRYTPQAPVGVPQTQATTNATVPPQPSFNYNPYLYGGGGYYPGPYGTYIQSPVSGYLQGAASLTTANAQYQSIMQDARLQQQQVYQTQVDTRRKMFDEMQYEKANTPTAQDLIEQNRAMALRHARNDPPNTEIWYGTALNSMLTDIQKSQTTQGMRGPLVPLDQNVLRHVNVTTGTAVGSVGVLRDGTNLTWPRSLRKERFAKERQRIEEAAPKAVKYAAGGNDQALDDLTSAVKDLKDKIKGAVVELSPDDYISGMRFANQLSDAIKTLEQPMAVNYLNGKWAAQGNNVGELVDYMTKNGLKFAPATEGDESYYSALYQSIRSYDAGLVRLAAR